MTASTPDAASSDETTTITTVLEQVLSAGATQFELDYPDDDVCIMREPVRPQLARLALPPDAARAFRAELKALNQKPKKLSIDGADYVVNVDIFEPFPDQKAFRVDITAAVV